MDSVGTKQAWYSIKIVNLEHIKQQLYDYCQAFISQRIETVKEAISEAQAAANDETKSSAGDKYETGRAMAQLEIEKNSTQLTETLKLKRILDGIRIDKQTEIVQPGSLVITQQSNFFIAISVGQHVIANETFLIVSAESPIGAKLKGLKAGESFSFNNKMHKIERVW